MHATKQMGLNSVWEVMQMYCHMDARIQIDLDWFKLNLCIELICRLTSNLKTPGSS